MQRTTITLLVGTFLLIAGGSLVVPQWLAEPEAPVGRWSAADEVEVPVDPSLVESSADNGDLDRSSVALAELGASADERVDVVLRGRIVDKWQAGVPAATVWLDFGRGGRPGGGGGGGANRQRRVPDPVRTDDDGRFAFQGQTFRNLRVWLQVAHPRFAPNQFDKDIGRVATEVDLGDLVLLAGGEVRGRVTDLEGNGIPNASLQLQPENGNPLRQLRDRDKLLPAFSTDQNGFFRREHAASGDWLLIATARNHTEGRSTTFAVEEELGVDVDDIRLGPGYELAGIVRDVRGQPIGKAAVVLQNDGRNRAPGGGPGGGGRQGGGPLAFGGGEHRTTTDEQGKFFLEHLPGVPLRLETDADGYLDYRQDGIDPIAGQQVFVTMQDGLRIEGRLQDSSGAPVTRFAVRAVRLRGLPVANQGDQGNVDIENLMAQLRSGGLDETTRNQVMARVEGLRNQFQGERGGRRGPGGRDGGDGPNGGRGGQAPRDLGKPEAHPDGAFVATGLQEGIYEVHAQSPDHARYRSAEIELRNGAATPQVVGVLDEGVYAAGVVLDTAGQPIRGARVELRTPSAFEGIARRGRGGQNNGGAGSSGARPTQATEGQDWSGMAREFARAANGSQLTLETTTDADGVFVVKHAPRGSYRLHAEAKGHANAATETFELLADRSGFELRLSLLGSIAGTVQGMRADEIGEVRVGAMLLANNQNGGGVNPGMLFGRGGRDGGGLFQNVIAEADGSYRLDNLAPGEYLVRSWLGSPQELMRELMPQFGDGTLRADTAVRAGEITKFDCGITRPQVGAVVGNVLHNGKAASGFQVELTRQDENRGNGGNAPGGNGGGRGRGGPMGFAGFGRTFQSVVAASGRVTFADVPIGNYRLRVQNSRRGGVLHEEIVTVEQDATVERSIVLQTHTLQGVVTRDDGGDVAELDGRVSLLPGLNAMPENLQAWQRENQGFDGRLQDGKFRIEALKPGGYLLVVNARGRERTSLQIAVQGDQTVTIAAGKPTTPNATPATGNPQATQPRPRNR